MTLADVPIRTVPPRSVAGALRRHTTGRRAPIQHAFFWVAAAVAVVYSVFPIIWILITSVKPQNELTSQPVTLIPSSITFDSYRAAFSQAAFGRYYLNSAIVVGISTAACLVLALMSGYALARLNFRGKPYVLLAILAASFFPPITQVVPLYTALRHVRLLDTYWAVIIPYTVRTLPIATWLLQAYLRDIPRDLEQSGMVDGLSRWRAATQLIFPIAIPGIATTTMIVFIENWNEFLYALAFLPTDSMRTLPVGIDLYPGQFSFPWGVISAATIAAILPLALLTLAFQRRLVSGLAAGAIK